jgi:hypothetical protein
MYFVWGIRWRNSINANANAMCFLRDTKGGWRNHGKRCTCAAQEQPGIFLSERGFRAYLYNLNISSVKRLRDQTICLTLPY